MDFKVAIDNASYVKKEMETHYQKYVNLVSFLNRLGLAYIKLTESFDVNIVLL